LYKQPKKLILSGSKLRPYFSPFVDQSSPNLVGVYWSDHSLRRRFPIDDSLSQSEIFAITSRRFPKSPEILMFLGRQIFAGGTPKFVTYVCKPGSPPNMWQSLVTIGQASSEIRRRKKSEKKTPPTFYNGRRPAISHNTTHFSCVGLVGLS